MLMRVVLQEINSSFIVTVWSPSCTRTQQERRHDSPRVTRWGCGRVGKTGGQRYVLPNGAPETTGDLRESPTVGYRCCPDRPDPELRLGSSTEPTNVRLESKRPGVDGLPYLAGRTLLWDSTKPLFSFSAHFAGTTPPTPRVRVSETLDHREMITRRVGCLTTTKGQMHLDLGRPSTTHWISVRNTWT